MAKLNQGVAFSKNIGEIQYPRTFLIRFEMVSGMRHDDNLLLVGGGGGDCPLPSPDYVSASVN